MYISPLYRLLYLNVEICQDEDHERPTASVSYDVEERHTDARIIPANNSVTRGVQERTFVFGSDMETTSLAEGATTRDIPYATSPTSSTTSLTVSSTGDGDSEFVP